MYKGKHFKQTTDLDLTHERFKHQYAVINYINYINYMNTLTFILPTKLIKNSPRKGGYFLLLSAV